MSEWLTLIEIDSEQSRLRITTSADADLLTMAVGYLFDNIGWRGEFPPVGMTAHCFGSSAIVRYEDYRVEARRVQHWPEIDFPEHTAVVQRLREKFPEHRQVVERA